MMMNVYELDPLGRGPKDYPPISQPPPPHPNSSADDTSFRPTSDSSPMFPDASFDVSTNKSSETNSRRRPLGSPHMAPPPLPPNAPSLYSRSLPPPLPTIVHRDDRWGDSQVPPSPMQIMMSRQSASASASHSREAREPHNDGHYPSPRINKRGGGREERVQPPPTTHDGHYVDSYDRGYHPDPGRVPYAHHKQHTDEYGNRHSGVDYQTNNCTLRGNSDHNPNQNSNMRMNSVEKHHHHCNCENCCYREQHSSSYYDDERNTGSYNSQPHQDVLQQHNKSNHRNYESTNEYSHHNVNYDPMINYGNSQHSHHERREPTTSRHYERVGCGTHQQHRYNGERRTPPPQSPLSPITHGWSPKSDNATLHAETFQVPQYVNSNTSNERREYEHEYHHHQGHHHDEGYAERPIRKQTDYNYETHPYSRDDHHCQEKRELSHSGRYYERQRHTGHLENGHVPTHVSYRSEESIPSPERRDDYSGSTIPTYSTNTPKRSSQSNTHRGSQSNLSVDIPVSPMDSSKSHRDRHYQHPPPNSSRSDYRYATSSYHIKQPYTTRSEPSQYEKSHTRTAVADKERGKSEARHQIMKEIHQATNMRNSALDSNDRKFWDKQIATLNASFKNL